MPKTAIVTGGSRGIGAATARLLAQDGYDVCLSYLADEDAAASVVTACRNAGRRAVAVRSDVGSRAAVRHLFEACDRDLGAPDLLVNNAGIVGALSRFESLGEEALRRTFEVNVYGTFWCAQEAVERMSTARGGRGGAIVNLSSIAAVLGSPGEYVHYAASKGAVETMTVGLAKEVGREGIRVNAIQVGTTDTEIHARSGNPDRPAMVAKMTALGRIATPEEIGEAVVFLASERSAFTTGAILKISGGI